jgi:DNA polymerase I-like protein with 3'-5' exonuclease and polymerase domains
MNSIAFFDIETNAIEDWTKLSDLETVHCIAIHDSTGTIAFSGESVLTGVERLKKYDAIVGHNSIGFDYPALYKMYGFQHPMVLDTAVMARCLYPDIKTSDYERHYSDPENGFPRALLGSHSLKAWGIRIGVYKDAHGDTEDWTTCTPEMIEYCKQDTYVTYRLYAHFLKKKPDVRMLTLEHKFAKLMRVQEWNGFPFDVKAAEKLTSDLMVRRAELGDDLAKSFGPSVETLKSFWWVAPDGTTSKTKKALVEAGWKPNEIEKGPNRTKEIPFNPNSRDQICERLMSEGWKPAAYDGKRPRIDEAVLKEIGTPNALKLLEYLLVSKRLGQVAEGNQAWLKLYNDGRIHGRVNTNGAISGRCTHSQPNVAQVPAGRAPYGKECRSCFTAPEGKVLVGADASGLELRCLAHYLHRWDSGAYAKEILTGDIHSANQKAAGLETRDQAKTFIYAFLYGAGDAKIGSIVGGSSKHGKKLKQSFMSKTPAIRHLSEAVANKVQQTNKLIGLDGRGLPCRSAHSALNLLLQSAGAVVMKQALVEFSEMATRPYELHGNIHDEVQFSCDQADADALGSCFVEALAKAGKTLGFKCPLDGEYSVGTNWSETH